LSRTLRAAGIAQGDEAIPAQEPGFLEAQRSEVVDRWTRDIDPAGHSCAVVQQPASSPAHQRVELVDARAELNEEVAVLDHAIVEHPEQELVCCEVELSARLRIHAAKIDGVDITREQAALVLDGHEHQRVFITWRL